MEHLYRMKCKNRVPLYDLLLEMLDAQRFHSSGKVQRAWAQNEKDPPSTPTTSRSSPSRSPGAMLPNTACHDQRPDPWAVYNPTTEECEAVSANLSNSFWRWNWSLSFCLIKVHFRFWKTHVEINPLKMYKYFEEILKCVVVNVKKYKKFE